MNFLYEISSNRSRGQGLVEYGLIIALVAVVAIAASTLLSNLSGSV